jgi:hypothetical protein
LTTREGKDVNRSFQPKALKSTEEREGWGRIIGNYS